MADPNHVAADSAFGAGYEEGYADGLADGLRAGIAAEKARAARAEAELRATEAAEALGMVGIGDREAAERLRSARGALARTAEKARADRITEEATRG